MSSPSGRETCRQHTHLQHTHLTNHGYFDYWKTRRPSKFSLMPGSRWHRFWDFWCISVSRIEGFSIYRIALYTQENIRVWKLRENAFSFSLQSIDQRRMLHVCFICGRSSSILSVKVWASGLVLIGRLKMMVANSLVRKPSKALTKEYRAWSDLKT